MAFRELTLKARDGFALNIQTEGEVSFSAQQHTDADLMNAAHQWELTPRPFTVLHLDAWLRGIGNASCGQDVDTLPQYRVPNRPLSYKLRVQQRCILRCRLHSGHRRIAHLSPPVLSLPCPEQ